MKKIIFAGILSILFASISLAQTRIGITAGLNASNLNTSGDETSSNFKAGFQAGLVADFGITESFSFMPELLFSQRGCKYKVGDITTTINYLQLPLNLAYKFDTGYGSNLFIFAGPYLGYAISGKSGPVDIKFGSGALEMKPLDFGINAGLGFQYEKVFFKVQFNPGLYNLSNVDGYSSKNINVAVTAGYYFN